MCLLAQTNPLDPRDSRENRASQLHHAHHVCGIVAHTRDDRCVVSVAARSLGAVGAALVDRPEQEEVLGVLKRIATETGWCLDRVIGELKGAWGWEGAAEAAAAAAAAASSVSGVPGFAALDALPVTTNSPGGEGLLALGGGGVRGGQEREGRGRSGREWA